MTRTIWIGLAVVVGSGCGGEIKEACLPDQVATPVAAVPHESAGFHVFGHAHNDYEHARPLADSLDNKFYSVEADLWFDDGKLTVSHYGFGSKGTLKDLYLDPLQARVDANGGSVHGDGVQFTLWVDFKEDKPGFNEALHTLLNGYPMLTAIEGSTVTEGAVTIALTGDRTAKGNFVTEFTQRRAFRDSNDYTPEDPPADAAWRFYALDWKKYLGWNGEGTLPEVDAARLGCIAENARADGRKLRFYSAPDKEAVWSTGLLYGVDFIHTDKLADLNAFFDSRQ